VNVFAKWMLHKKDRKQKIVAEKLGISRSTLHDILRKDQMPSLKLAYAIQDYTEGDITLYDWIDQRQQENKASTKVATKPNTKKINK